METVKGQVVTVTRGVAGSTLVVDAVATDTVLFLDDVSTFDEAGGSVSIEGAAAVTYDSVDRDANTITLSAGLAGGLTAYETFVAVSPEAPSQTAEVLLQDDSGVTVSAVVPQAMWALLSEGIREPEDREPVTLLLVGDDWTVYDVEFRPSLHDATTTPIIVTNAAGESATVTADGFLTSTNDPVPIRAIPGTFQTMTASGGYVFGGSLTQIRKFDESTGEETIGGGWPVSVPASTSIAADGGYVYTLNSGVNIRKFAVSNGVEVVAGGWPKAVGTATSIHAAGGFVYLTDASTVLRKYAASNGVEDTTADWPIAADLRRPGISGGFVYAADVSSGAIRKFDDATGTEDTSGPYPLAGSWGNLDADDTYLYPRTPPASSSNLIDKIDIATGEVWAASGFPLDPGSGATTIAVDGDYLCTNNTGQKAIRLFNRVEGYQSTNRNSSDGSDVVHKLTVSDLNVSGLGTFTGPASIPALGQSDQKSLSGSANPTSTTNINLTDLDMTFDVNGPDDVVWVDCDAEVTIGVAGTVNIIELLIDGVAQPKQLRHRNNATNTPLVAGYKKWRLTGLAAGSHTIAFRTRNSAAATNATVSGFTSASYWTST